MVEVGPALQELFPDIVVDGKIGRQMYQAPEVIKILEIKVCWEYGIIELGANGAFAENSLQIYWSCWERIGRLC